MATRQLGKPEWQAFFDQMSKAVTGKRVEIEIASLAFGSQIEAEWLPLLGITYEPKSDILEIALDGVDHLVHAPQEVYAEDGLSGLESLEIVDGDGARQIIKLRDSLMLPLPG